MKFVHGLIITLGVFFLTLLLSVYQPFYLDFEHKTYDLRYQFKVKKQNFEDIAIVDIDVRSLEKLGRFQNWPRIYFAEVIRYLKVAKIIGVDILFAEADSLTHQAKQAVGLRLDSLGISKEEVFSSLSFDRDLAQAIKENGKVVLLASYEDDQLIEPLDIFKNEALAVGVGTVVPDLDGVLRRARPCYDLVDGSPPLPNFGYLIAARASSDTKVDINRMYNVGFLGSVGSFRRVSFFDVLEKRIPREFFRDKIILIGATALGLFDNRPVPFDPIFPGVELNANLIYDYLNNYFIKKVPDWLTLIIIFFLALLTVLIFFYLRPFSGAILIIIVLLCYLVLSNILFIQNIWIEIIRPTYAIIFALVATIGYRVLFEERQKKFIKDMFSRYVAKEVVDELVTNPPVLGGKKIDATVLFADIRNFTTLSERLSPDAIVKILNEYFTVVADEIFKYKGMVDKYMGDGIMAVFGAPVSYHDHALRAVKAALEMKDRVKEIQEKYPIKIGIGINSGLMVCGNIGSHKRMDYTVIGDNVNLAARIEPLTKEFEVEVIISEKTYQAVANAVTAHDLGSVKVRGREKEIRLYEVTGLRDGS